MRAAFCAIRGVHRERAWFLPALFVASLFVASFAACRPPVAENDWPTAETVGELRIGRPVIHENLTIFPVYSRTAKNDDRFITLDEGLQAGTVEIMETGAIGNGEDDNGVTMIHELPIPELAESNVVRAPEPNVPVEEAVDDPFGNDVSDASIVQAQESDPFDSPVAQTPRPSNHSDDDSSDETGHDDRRRVGELIEQYDATAGVNGDVNRLMVVNHSDKPLYLMPGEVIIGGKQDRTVGQEIVIAPSKKPVPIDAFCVEHGRWGGRGVAGLAMLASGGVSANTWDEAGEDGNAVDLAGVGPLAGYAARLDTARISTEALNEAAAKADQGQFVAPAGTVNSKVRFAIVGQQSQTVVWDEVAKTNAATGNDLTAATGGFTGNYFDPQVLDKIDPYVAKLNDSIARTDRVVGVIVAIDGKFVTMDVFESTPLFAKLWPKLLRSYALDAAIAAAEKTDAEKSDAAKADNARANKATIAAEPTPAPRIADARAFLADALRSGAEEATTVDGLVTTKRSGRYCVSFTCRQQQPVPYATSAMPASDGQAGTDAAGAGASTGSAARVGYGGDASFDTTGAGDSAGVHTSAFGK